MTVYQFDQIHLRSRSDFFYSGQPKLQLQWTFRMNWGSESGSVATLGENAIEKVFPSLFLNQEMDIPNWIFYN